MKTIQPIERIEITKPVASFAAAEQLARTSAAERGARGDLLSWFEQETGRYSPWVPEQFACHSDQHAYWERYALHRGARLRVEVNGGAFVFIFA